MAWDILSIIFICFIATGLSIDRLMLYKHKNIFYNKILFWWVWLDNTDIKDLPKEFAKNTLEAISKRKKYFWSKNTLLILIIFFWLIPSVLFLLGLLIELEFNFFELFNLGGVPLPIFTVYLINVPFDVITLLITYKVIYIISERNYFEALIVIVLDVLLALMLAVFCFSSILYADHLSKYYQLLGTELGRDQDLEYIKEHFQLIYPEDFEDLKKQLDIDENNEASIYIKFQTARTNENIFMHFYNRTPEAIYKIITEGKFNYSLLPRHVGEYEYKGTVRTVVIEFEARVGWAVLLLAFTTFIPTLIYMIYILLILISKCLLSVVRKLLLYYFELALEVDPSKNHTNFMPIGLLAISLSCFASLINAIYQTINLIFY